MGSVVESRPATGEAGPASAPTDHHQPEAEGRLTAPRQRRPRLGRSGLWRRPDFLRLWAAESVSQLGSQVSLLAFPLIAALTLEASAFEVGLLAAAQTAPFLLVGLFAGVWVDRLRRRPILIAADLGRAALLLAIPVAGLLGLLGMPLLYAVALLTGSLTLFFDVAFLSYLPALVAKEELVDGNSKLQASASGAQVVGPGLAGALIGAAGAPVALLVDAVSFLVSALFLLRIGAAEPPAPPPSAPPHVWREIREGLAAVGRHAVLRALAACSATTSFFAYIFFAVYVLYLTRELGLTPGAIGLVFATGGVGALFGALLATPIRRRFGVGRTILASQLLFGISGLVIPLAAIFPAIALEMVVASELLQWLTVLVYSVNAVSLRQSLTPNRLLGRVNATMRFLVGGMQPLGSLLGGALGGIIGLPLTLVVGELGMFVAFLWLLASPLPGLRTLSTVDAPLSVADDPAVDPA